MDADRKIRSTVCAALPKLGWIATVPLAGGDVRVLHGSAVEHADDWLVEGVWDAPFEGAAFHRSEAFFGSGLRVEGGKVFAVASTGMVDRLVFVVGAGELTISNSLVALLAATGARLAIDHDYRAECSASLKGIFGQPYVLTTEGGRAARCCSCSTATWWWATAPGRCRYARGGTASQPMAPTWRHFATPCAEYSTTPRARDDAR